MQWPPYEPKPEQCDFCGLNEEEIRNEYDFVEDEEVTFYQLGPEGELTLCEFCKEHRYN